jgi:hypothetical protein
MVSSRPQVLMVAGSRNQIKARYLNEIAGFPFVPDGTKIVLANSWKRNCGISTISITHGRQSMTFCPLLERSDYFGQVKSKHIREFIRSTTSTCLCPLSSPATKD